MERESLHSGGSKEVAEEQPEVSEQGEICGAVRQRTGRSRLRYVLVADLDERSCWLSPGE